MPSALQLPSDSHRTPGSESRFAAHAFQLPPAPDALLAAAFGVQLFRYNAQSAITLNASRVTAAGERRWRRPFALTTAVASTGRNVLEQAESFFSRVEAEAPDLRSEHSRAGVVFLESTALDEAPARANVDDDLQLVIARSGEFVQAAFVYNSSLFKAASIRRFADHLARLSAHLAADPAAAISRLPLMGPEERRWVESVCDGRPRASPAEYVHRSFEARAAAAPDATAVRYRDQSLTYRQLNARANLLARWLIENGIGAESRVVACLEPSFDVAVALLAILKAGAVYVPLDPAYPPARIHALLDDVRPRLVITRAHLNRRISFEGFPPFALEDLDVAAHGLPETNPELAVRPDQTAYVYYTSGTTGKPKGAAASQRNLASYIRAARDRYQIGPSDVMPAIARFSFSISMFELMSPLAAGGTLVILDRDHILDLDRMSRTLEETTFFHAGPSLLKNLLARIKRRYPDFGSFSRVRHASSGGDMVSPEVLEGLKTIFSNAEVFVIYGCSEISCMGCTYPVTRERAVERTFVGRPFDNMAVRVLDSALNLLPVGAVGEIHFAGDGIVNGYLNRPELTAEKFIELEGRRFYRTGDMGRLSEDGWLEILGRSDFQVKLRGMRVELGEVEHHLRRAAGVRDGVVMTKPLAGDEKSLVAYIVADRDGTPLASEGSLIESVHRHMVEHLPDYMVPAMYVELDSLPLNHNMKVDRYALPDPKPSARRIAAGERLREPRTPSEKRLAALWGKLLGLERIGLDDHFFDLGGHSVLGITLILDVESELGVVLTGMEILRESLEGQAAICDRRLGQAAEPSGDSGNSSSPRPAAEPDFEAFYFGKDRDLYGVLSGSAAGEAVLICSSVGQEHFRAHFILQRLAKRLAERGVPALRFDYFGCGDSQGERGGAACGRWRRDIGEAYQELKRRTGAARITAVGARLGAVLLGDAARDLEFERLVFWDPARDGSSYLAEMSKTHEKFSRSWRWLLERPPSNEEGGAELMGLSYTESNVRALEGLVLEAGRRGVPLKWLATSRGGAQERLFRALAPDRDGSRLEVLELNSDWDDAARLGNLLPDVGISAKLAALATERS